MRKVDKRVLVKGCASSSWSDGFEFPKDFIWELMKKFSDPDYDFFHHALHDNDQSRVWGFLHTYEKELRKVTPEIIIELASKPHGLSTLVDEMREAVEFSWYLVDLERRYFPERIKAREARNRDALASWE